METAFDISILDDLIKTPIKPLDKANQSNGYNAPALQNNTLQPAKNDIRGMIEISKGIKSGNDVAPILLKALEIISSLTGDNEFYTTNKDMIQGMGLLECIPAEWEQDDVNSSLQRLEESRHNIGNAIQAHKRRLSVESADIENDDYTQKIKQSFKVASNFMTEHKHARTEADWDNIAANMGPCTGNNQFTIGLVLAVVDELEREYKEVQKKPEI